MRQDFYITRGNDAGAAMIEYALVAMLIAVICVLGVTVLGNQTSTMFSSIGSGLASN